LARVAQEDSQEVFAESKDQRKQETEGEGGRAKAPSWECAPSAQAIARGLVRLGWEGEYRRGSEIEMGQGRQNLDQKSLMKETACGQMASIFLLKHEVRSGAEREVCWIGGNY
jgi:hypothetical protein